MKYFRRDKNYCVACESEWEEGVGCPNDKCVNYKREASKKAARVKELMDNDEWEDQFMNGQCPECCKPEMYCTCC